jgi:hypothetical protein
MKDNLAEGFSRAIRFAKQKGLAMCGRELHISQTEKAILWLM